MGGSKDRDQRMTSLCHENKLSVFEEEKIRNGQKIVNEGKEINLRGGCELSHSPPHWAWLKIKSWYQFYFQSSRVTTEQESWHHCAMCAVQARGSHTMWLRWGRWATPLGAVVSSQTIRKRPSWVSVWAKQPWEGLSRAPAGTLHCRGSPTCQRQLEKEAQTLSCLSLWGAFPTFRVFTGALHLLPQSGLFSESAMIKQFTLGYKRHCVLSQVSCTVWSQSSKSKDCIQNCVISVICHPSEGGTERPVSQQVDVRAPSGDRSSNSRVGAVLPSRLSCLIQV